MRLHGRAWVFGDDIPVERFIPGRYDHLMYTGEVEELATHLFEDWDPRDRPPVKAGDVIVAGRGFGHGKHHDGLILAMRHLGLAGYIADGFHPLFHRTCVDLGIPACSVLGLSQRTDSGDLIDWSLADSTLTNVTKNLVISVTPVPPLARDILESGGWAEYVRAQVTGNVTG